MAIRNPVHPGDFVKTEIIEANGLSVTAAAKVLGVSRPAVPVRYRARLNPPLGGSLAICPAVVGPSGGC